MNGQTNYINKKWIVFNTTNTSLTGWHSFSDSYILDFTDYKNLKIKTLGDNQIINIPYSFDSENGNIFEDNGEILYRVQKLSSNKLTLKMDVHSNTTVSLVAISDKQFLPDIHIEDILKKNRWSKDSNDIIFTDEQYRVVGEIETSFNIFIEHDTKTKKEYKGAWHLDSYEGLYFLELYSERFNHKSIYQIELISEKQLRAVSSDKNGNPLVMELSAK